MSLAQVKLDARDYLEGKDAKLLCSNFKGAVTILDMNLAIGTW